MPYYTGNSSTTGSAREIRGKIQGKMHSCTGSNTYKVLWEYKKVIFFLSLEWGKEPYCTGFYNGFWKNV